MSAWRIHALAAEIKGLAGNAVAHARIRDPDNVMVARNALEKIRRLLAEDGDE
ncbi:hypothetical protein [Novosphingobium sp. SG707]|uniref:hypothetical protein n=1 Tax=Novosphingobium sp. SG707 TaxID=2586996 RepID=UPI00144621BA|nr:hypothetical protein [Novosphingobium sp. SG707]